MNTEELRDGQAPSHILTEVRIEGVDHPLLVGLSWHTEQVSPEDNKEQKRTEILASIPKPFGVVLSHEFSIAVGLADQASIAKKSKPMVAAAIASNICEDQERVLFVESVGDGLWWLCAIQFQIPVATTDVVLGDEAAARIAEYEAYGFTVLEEGSFAQRIQKVGKTAFKNAKPHQIIKYNRKVVGLAVSLATLMVLGFLGNTFYQNTIKREIQARAAVESANAAARKRQTQIEQQRVMMSQLASKINAVGIREAVDAWLKSIQAVPLHREGWDLRKAECTINHCVLVYDRNDGTLKEFPEADGRLNRLDVAEVRIANSRWERPQVAYSTDKIDAQIAKLDNRLHREIISAFQIVNTVGGKAAATVPAQHQSGKYLTGTFEISAGEFELLAPVTTKLHDIGVKQSFQPLAFEMSAAGGKVNWKLRGEYVFQK